MKKQQYTRMDKKYPKIPYLGKGTSAKNFWVSYHQVNSLKVHANLQKRLSPHS